ncbi:MAG: glycosyltransferase family 39 protein [Candidatus Micrarchaeota archaeon]|nr:glycosyltransferase family 39 protein [Candidatus Micrarchaeota archaeon]
MAIINRPSIPQIGDESIYVPAALRMLNSSGCTSYSTYNISKYQTGCNLVHPPLVKLVVAGSIAIFGNDPFAWRIFDVIAGALSIILVFNIARELTKREDIALLSAGLLGVESLFFVQSSGALLDVPSIFFGLIGVFLYLKFRGQRLSYANTLYVSVPLALSILSKETGIVILAFIVLYDIIINKKKQLGFLALTIVFTLAFSFIGLQLFDSLFVNISAVTNIDGLIQFHLAFSPPLWNETAWPLSGITSLLGPQITPLNWITLYSPNLYYGFPQLSIINYTQTVGNTTTTYIIHRYGTTHYGVISNMVEVWLIFIWVPLFLYYLFRKQDSRFGKESVIFVLLAFFLIYGGYVLFFLLGHGTFPYYFVEFSPFLAIADSLFICNLKSTKLKLLFVALCVIWFLWFFPVYPFIIPVSPYGFA